MLVPVSEPVTGRFSPLHQFEIQSLVLIRAKDGTAEPWLFQRNLPELANTARIRVSLLYRTTSLLKSPSRNSFRGTDTVIGRGSR
jgi:hypothetical protein